MFSIRKVILPLLLALLLASCAKENIPTEPVYPDAARLPTLPSRTATPPSPATTGTATPTYFGTPPTEVPATFYYTLTPHPATPTSTSAGTPTPTHEPGPQDYRLSTLKMVNELDGWATFRLDEAIAAQFWLGVTHDGARTWLNVTPPVFEAIRSYRFPNMGVRGAIQVVPLDPETAWAYTGCLFLTACNFPPAIWRTDDGGRSWQTVHVPSDCAGVESDCIPDNLQFVDRQHGWAFMMQVGRNSITHHLYRTVNGGYTWQALPRRIDWISSDLIATRPLFLDQTLGLRLRRTYVTSAILFAHVVPLEQLLAGTAFTIEITRNGGDSWTETHLPLPPDFLVRIKAQNLTDENELLIDYSPLSISSDPPLISFQAYLTLHRDQPPIFRATYFSTDRGYSWHILSKPGDSFFLDASNGFRLAAADSSLLEITTDGGDTWRPYLDTTWELGEIQDKNIAIHLSEGGQARQEIETSFLDERLWPGQGVRLESLHMQDRLVGWGMEVGGVTLCTQDGARTWEPCIPAEDVVPTEVVPPDTEGVWSPAEMLPDELFHSEPIPPELQRWIENGRQFLPGIDTDSVWSNPFAYFCKTSDADVMGDGEAGVDRRCVIRFPTEEGSVYGYYVAYWLTYYSLTLAGEKQQVWPASVDIDFLDQELGWRLLDTGSRLFRLEQTEDGGRTWKLVKTVSWIGQLEFVGAKEGYALAFEPPTRDTPAELFFVDAMRPSSLLHTVDGGRTWDEIQPLIGP
jgi:hypothetical protein